MARLKSEGADCARQPSSLPKSWSPALGYAAGQGHESNQNLPGGQPAKELEGVIGTILTSCASSIPFLWNQ